MANPFIERAFLEGFKLGTPSSMPGDTLISMLACDGQRTRFVERSAL